MSPQFSPNPIPAKAGIGLRSKHLKQIINSKPDISWLEIHSENFFAQGGINLQTLEQIRSQYPLSMHGVGLSLGTSDKLDESHLKKLKKLIDIFEPDLVSEHISWSSVDNIHFSDLLPLPYTQEALDIVANNIRHIQEYLNRQILIENPSSYLEFKESDMSEYEFVIALIKKTGCGLLLDINNLYVNSINHNFDSDLYLENIQIEMVKEIHLAGYEENIIFGNKTILIDTHSRPVYPKVWELYKKAISKFGKIPTLIEWDSDIPDLEILLSEANKAQVILDEVNNYATT